MKYKKNINSGLWNLIYAEKKGMESGQQWGILYSLAYFVAAVERSP